MTVMACLSVEGDNGIKWDRSATEFVDEMFDLSMEFTDIFGGLFGDDSDDGDNVGAM